MNLKRKKGFKSGRYFRGLPQSKIGGRKGQFREERVAESNGNNLTGYRNVFLEHLTVMHYCESTITGIRRNLLYFLEWAHERDLNEAIQITRPLLESYRRHIYHHRKANGKPLAVKSQKERLQVIKVFFRWLCKENHLPANPASELEMPRAQKRLPEQTWSINDVHEILSQPDILDILGLRDRTMLELLYSTGMRRSELSRLEITDINLEKETVFIRQGKGKKDRYVPLGKTALQWLERYLSNARPQLEGTTAEATLFITHLGAGFNPDALGRLVRNYIIRAQKRGGCHQFRHSCATHMLENGADIRYIQQLLGHSRLESTSIYTQVSIQKLKQVHQRTHPRV